MSDYQNSMIYGDVQNTSAIPYDMLNPGATNWNEVISNGIRGAAQAAISASVGEKFADGQLVATRPPTAQAAQSNQTFLLLAAGALILMTRR